MKFHTLARSTDTNSKKRMTSMISNLGNSTICLDLREEGYRSKTKLEKCTIISLKDLFSLMRCQI